MSLKELDNKDRILFLLDFVGELVINSAKDENLKNLIKSEKIKKKYLEPEENIDLGHITKTNAFKDKEYEESDFVLESMQETRDEPVKTIMRLGRINQNRSNMRVNKLAQKSFKPNVRGNVKGEMTFPLKEDRTNTVSIASSFDPLSKVSSLIKDNNVQLIECPGPGKNLLVKSRNKINLTKISLSEQDIEGIINHFSKESRIPIMNGILKSAIGDLIISAVVSKFIGSRFIITKKSPYSLIEGKGLNNL